MAKQNNAIGVKLGQFLLMTILFPSSIFCSQQTASAIKLKYEDLPQILTANNSLLRARQIEVDATQERSGYLERSFWPNLHINTSIDTFRYGSKDLRIQPQLSAILTMNIYNGGRDAIQDDVNRAYLQRSQSTERLAYQEQLFQVKKLFWRYLYHLETQKIYDAAISSNEVFYRQAVARVAAGRGSQSDSLEFQLQRNMLQQTQERAKLDLIEVQGELLADLGLKGETSIEILTQFNHQHSLRPSYPHSENHHHFQAALDADSQVKRLHAEKAQRVSYPTLEVFGGIQQYNQREREAEQSWQRFEQVVGVRLSMLLGAGVQAAREQTALQLEAEALDLEKTQRLLEFEQHITIETNKARVIQQQLQRAEENIQLGKRYLKMTLEDYRLGVKNSADVLAASQKLIEVKHNHIELIYELKVIISHLESYLG